MKVIKSMLEEELANSLAMKKDYERELAKLPKGSLIKKKPAANTIPRPIINQMKHVKFFIP